LFVVLEGHRIKLIPEKDRFKFTTGDMVWNKDKSGKELEWFTIEYDKKRNQLFMGSPDNPEWKLYLVRIDLQESSIPQILPVELFLHAIKFNDVDMYCSIMSAKLKNDMNNEADSLKTILENYQKIFKKEFGEYEMEDFTFS